jgi:two-component system OmpR family sensor kinase
VTAPRSLQARIAAGLVAVVALAWILASAAVLHALRLQLDDVFDSALMETAQRLLPLAVAEVVGREDDGGRRLGMVREHRELLSYVVRDEKGAAVLQSHDADVSVFPATVPQGFSSTPTHRLYAESALRGTLTIVLAEPLQVRSDAIGRALRALALPLLILVPLGLVATWWLVAVAMRPVRRLCAAIEQRGAGDLSQVSATGLPTEVEPIVTAVNMLMERLRRALDAERNFAAKSAHELRTPIAAALAQTQRLLAESTVPATRDRARQVEDTLRTLTRLSEKLLQLARAEGGGLLREEAQDVVPILHLVCRDVERMAGAAGRVVLSVPPAPVPALIDPDALAIVVRNLVENALRHGAPEAAVVVDLTADAVLRVTNAGPVVPAEALANLVRPFERAGARVPGSGLGLAIADAVARGAKTELVLRSPVPGRGDGFEASLRLAP